MVIILTLRLLSVVQSFQLHFKKELQVSRRGFLTYCKWKGFNLKEAIIAKIIQSHGV